MNRFLTFSPGPKEAPAVGYIQTRKLRPPSVESLQLTSVLPLEPEIDRNVATHALPTAKNFFLVPIFTFPVHSYLHFLPNRLPSNVLFNCTNLGHSAHSGKRFEQVPVLGAYEI